MGGTEVKQSDAASILFSGPKSPDDTAPLLGVCSNTDVEIPNSNDSVLLCDIQNCGLKRGVENFSLSCCLNSCRLGFC